ncbi:hypothetical protein ACE6H2_000813 [Prunus campanulata]
MFEDPIFNLRAWLRKPTGRHLFPPMDENVGVTKSGISNRNAERFHQVLVETRQGGDFFCILKFCSPR